MTLLFFGCGMREAVNDNRADGAYETRETLAMEDEPVWAQGIQTEGELFQHLNLDGIGDFDDEAYISLYQFGGFEDKCMVLRIHLGTGETMARILPVYGQYSLQTGKLFSEEKQALVLEVDVPGSNYGAANLFVFDVFPVGPDPIPTVVDRFNTTAGPIVSALNEMLIDSGSVTGGAEITNIEGFPLQGLTVYSTGQKGQWHEVQKTLFWSGENDRADDGWALLTE